MAPRAGLITGPQIGIVTDPSGDPSNSASVRINIPALSLDLIAMVCSPFGNAAALGRPQISDKVLVIFVGGNVEYPIVIGKVRG